MSYREDEQPEYGSGRYKGGQGGGYSEQSDAGYGRQGGHAGGNATHGGGYPAGGGFQHEEDEDFRGAAHHASNDAGDSGDSGFFGQILGQLSQRKHEVAHGDVDEEEAVRHHKKYFGGDDDGQEATSGGMGAAAAMQALKMFSGGSAGGSGGSQSQFIGLACSQAAKLFDQQASAGKVSSGSDKESAVTQAAEMALKMYMKSQGGGSSSGVSGLMGLASKFM